MKLFLLIASMMIGSEPPDDAGFEKVYGGEAFDRGVFVSRTSDGGYVAVGVTKSFGEGGDDIYVVRTDGQGESLWSRTYGGPDAELGWSVHEVADGFILAGSTKSFGSGDFDFYLVKTDADGESEWSKTFGGKGSERCWALALTTDGGFVLAGETTSSGAGEEDCYLVKTDASGVEQWSRTYGGAKGDRCFAIVQAGDGGYVLAGQTYSEGAGDRDAYIIKTSADGEKEWSKTFGGPASDVAHGVTRTSDGSFFVTGYTTSFAKVDDDPYLIKIDADGNAGWTRVLPMDGTNHTLTAAQATDGGFFLVGFSRYPTRGVSAALLIKTDAEGHLEWQRDVLPTRTGDSFGYTVCATPDGGCVFAGHSTTGAAGDRDLLLVEVKGDDRP